MLDQLNFRQKSLLEIDLPQGRELRIDLHCVQKDCVGGFPQRTLAGMAQGRNDEGQVAGENEVSKFFGLDVGDDFIEEEDRLVVYFLLVLFVE